MKLRGLQHIHERGYRPRDITLENCAVGHEHAVLTIGIAVPIRIEGSGNIDEEPEQYVSLYPTFNPENDPKKDNRIKLVIILILNTLGGPELQRSVPIEIFLNWVIYFQLTNLKKIDLQ